MVLGLRIKGFVWMDWVSGIWNGKRCRREEGGGCTGGLLLCIEI